jgi:hypothetical protein
VVLPRIGEVYFPVEEGVDVILLTLRFDRERKKIDDPSLNTLIDFGYGGTTLKNSTGATGVIANVPEMIRQTGATTLAQLIDGQLPGVSLSGGGAIRGGRGGAPLIFLDGIPSSLEQVENGFFYQLATIVVDKNGAAYGHQGANGAIHFYTQKHFTTQE